MRHYQANLLDAAIRHAKKNMPRLSERKGTAIFFVECEYQALKKARRYDLAHYCFMLLQQMKRVDLLSSLLENLRSVETSVIADQAPCRNTGPNSPSSTLLGGSGSIFGKSGYVDPSYDLLEEYIGGSNGR